MIYAQLHDLKSLRDLEIAFNSQHQLKQMLHGKEIKRSTLSDANARRPAECFLWIAEQLTSLLPRKQRKEVNKVVRKLDSSPIQLKGRGYDEWTLANRTLRCQGVKLHVEYDGELDAPTGFRLSRANVNDSSMGLSWPIISDTIYVFDKGYYDFNW
jgi:putative transposase